MKQTPEVFSVSLLPGVSELQWASGAQNPGPGQNREVWEETMHVFCFVLFVFHEGQARLQLLLPPLPALGCAAFSLLEEEEAASWPGLLGTLQASKTLAPGPRDIQTGLETCAVAQST